MKLSDEQLECVVREVVRRLQSTTGGAKSTPTGGHLKIADRLVTTETLRNQLDGITHVDVSHRAVVTPAVIDLLKERRVKLVRGTKPIVSQ